MLQWHPRLLVALLALAALVAIALVLGEASALEELGRNYFEW
jgi:hypothetical protein